MPTDKPAQIAEPQEFDLTIDEFCARQSGRDGRVEMIAAFRGDELRSGRIKDVESNFAARYAAFTTRPA